MTDNPDIVTVEKLIHAPASAIFAFLVDPAKHHEIAADGSVQGAQKGAPKRLELGSKFGMSMKIGLPYSMVSTVIELEEDRLIAWQTHGPTPLGKLVAGRIWRYELEPVDGGTLVRESRDITKESILTKPLVRMQGEAVRKNIADTLDRIAGLVEE